MLKTFLIADHLVEESSESEASESGGPEKLPGLYSWQRFDRCTREQWIDSYGIGPCGTDVGMINPKAAHAYLKGEAVFFGKFEGDYSSVLGTQRALAVKQRTLEDKRSQFNHGAALLCRSPIEQLLLAGLLWTKYGYESHLVEIWDSAASPKPLADIVIAPQYPVEKYLVDLAIRINGIGQEEIKVAVECDGHEWHKSKEQTARDKRRDRDLTIAGWKPLRFTGSEIWQDHRACASHVGKVVAKELDAQLRRRIGYDRGA